MHVRGGADVGDVFVGVESLGESTLVGDQHHFETGFLRQGQGLHHSREDGELGEVLGVVPGSWLITPSRSKKQGRRLMLQT